MSSPRFHTDRPLEPTAPAAADVASGSGFRALFGKEVLRFWKVSTQTVSAPVLTTLLYLLIFAHVLGRHVQVYEGVAYPAFLVPGLAMMAILQNAFANSSSSLIQSKMTGNLIFILLPPLTPAEVVGAYVLAAVVRGLVCGVAVLAIGVLFVPVPLAHPLAVLAFAVLGAAVLGALGLIAAIRADRVDELSAFQHFIVLPLTFLAGVFYSIHSLPEFWQTVSHANPVFYMVDGFRWGFFGVSDVSPWISLTVVALCCGATIGVALHLIASGHRLRY